MADDAGADLDLEAFRIEAREWLEANFPRSLMGQSGYGDELGDAQAPDSDLMAWRQRIGEKGWATPTWPAKYGGGGLSVKAARVLQQEMARIGAFNPLMFGMGVTMIGPTLLDYGTPEQLARHLPGIIKGTARWCVGYSEPGAGSDLASLQTKCEDAGDHWVVNGQKVWASGAQWS